MTPALWLRDEVRAWVWRAEKDIEAARLLSSGGLLAEAVYHLQQAAEKFLKAFLVDKQTPFSKTHDIGTLLLACGMIDPILYSELEPASILTQYASQFRYPAEIEEPGVGEAARALELALLVRAGVTRRLTS